MKFETQFKVTDVKFETKLKLFQCLESMNDMLNQLHADVIGKTFSVIKDYEFELTEDDVVDTLREYIPSWVTGFEYLVYDPTNTHTETL